jgi:hypothetical protein
VLFSNPAIADFINENFEPAWQSLRPAPLVTVDFGNGRKVVRTLHGNVATYVCDAEGAVLDILPGVYTPDAYRRQLDELLKLRTWLSESPRNTLRRYHALQAEALQTQKSRAVFANSESRGASIFGIERGLELVLSPADRRQARLAIAEGRKAIEEVWPASATEADLSDWKLLVEDTRVNETERRLRIHRYLAEQLASGAPPRPDDITKWLYREVLRTDLDDPYLGLGRLLFTNDPFHPATKTP